MAEISGDVVADTLTLRFVGEEDDGSELHELRASHVAEVLQGLVGMSGDFEKAGAFGEHGPSGSEVLVRPAQEGSFLIEVIRVLGENWEGVAAVTGPPTLGQIIWWATKSIRADVAGVQHLDNGNVVVQWQDNTIDEVPEAAWRELNLRKRRRKKQLRQIMAPLSDGRVTKLDVASTPDMPGEVPETEVFELDRSDYNAVRPEDEVEETSDFVEVEAQMSAIDFDDPTRWKVKTRNGGTRTAAVEDTQFLARVAAGLAIRKTDIFRLKVRIDTTTTNGSSRTKWTVRSVEEHRRAAGDDE